MSRFVFKTILFCSVSSLSYSFGGGKPDKPEPPPEPPPPTHGALFQAQNNLSPGIIGISNPWTVPAEKNQATLSFLEDDGAHFVINGQAKADKSILLKAGDTIQIKTQASTTPGKTKSINFSIDSERHQFSIQSSSESARSQYYRAMYKGDPSKEIFIGYRGLGRLSDSSKIYYDTRDCGTDLNCYRNYENSSYEVNHKSMNNIFVHLDNLNPQTRYYFVVVENSQISQRFYVETMSNSRSDRISFIAGGDSRNNQTVRRQSNSMVSKLNPHFVLFGGDMTGADTSWEWKQWLGDWQLTHGSDGKMTPIITARGNHERSDSSIEKIFFTEEDVYYSVSMNGGLLKNFVLNTERSISGNQTSWLKEELENSDELWKVAIYHKPMRPHTSGKSEGSSQYSSWARAFYENGVQLVVESDSHTVKRTYPVRPVYGRGSDEGFIEAADGTVYIGEGCWGAPLRSNDDNKDWTRASGSFNQFNWIWVDQHKTEIRTVKTHNPQQVGQVGANKFEEPANIDVWEPSSGRVVTINIENFAAKAKKRKQLAAK